MGRGMLAQNQQPRVQVTRWEPNDNDQWYTLIQQTGQANIAHAPQWFSAIRDAYGHRPLYLQAEDEDGQLAILPAFLIRSRLFGTVVTSMPFLDVGGPCSPSPRLAQVLVDALIEETRQLGGDLVELRCTEELGLSVPASGDKVNLVLPLMDKPEYLWRQLSAKVRNQVRKAERSGLTVEFGGVEKVDDFYEVFAVNMRDLGSPVHARGFFYAIFDSFKDKARVVLVRKGSIPVGGLVALAFKDTLVVPWASSLRQYFSLCPNMLLYWETIRTACLEGFQQFDFGRSSHGSNTYRFKRQWGALEEQLFWYTLSTDTSRRERLMSDEKHKALFVQAWQRLPLGITRRLGPHIRKYITL